MSHMDEFVFSVREMPLTSFRTFEAMRLKGSFCDVIFQVENVKISAHRLVLAANIPYLNEVFLQNHPHDDKITFKMVELNAFKSLIQFAYTGEIKINAGNAKNLLIAAKFLQMDQICDACTEFIARRLRPVNAFEIKKFAATHLLVKLEEAANNYILKHVIEISHSEEFLDMSFSDLRALISKNESYVTCMQKVSEAVTAWVRKSPLDREEKISDLLNLMKIPFCGCHNWLTRDYFYAICRMEKGLNPTFVARYDLTAAKWHTMNSKTIFVKYAAVVVMDKKLYVIGGCNSIGNMLNAVQVFDPESDSWNKVASLRQKIRQVAAAVYSNKIYVFGGELEGGDISKYVECYSPEKESWDYLSNMYEYRREACAVAANECIYVLGGYGYVGKTQEPLSSAEMYNVKKQQWTKISSMSMPLSHFGAICISGRIYVYGNKFIEFYDPWLETWDRISYVQKSKNGFSLLTFRGKLFAVGGENVSTVDIYDLETDEWNEGKSLPADINFIGAGAITEHLKCIHIGM